jgi:superfamily II DNA helicase RecQ
VPIVALTATATPVVQEDICEQLRLRHPRRFIHGFRRENLAVRAIEATPSERAPRMLEILSEPDRLPAIVYAPTRKKAEEISESLGRKFRAAAYHAGMPAGDRERVQLGFLNGALDVIVATVAFGMGIDKANVRTVIHAALPGTVEGYYQEIGRAGRDGLPSQAVLLHGFSDRKTHEFFLERDYPDPELLGKVRHAVPRSGTIPRIALQDKMSSIEADVFEKALEKLWLHGGLAIDPEENISSGPTSGWRKAYEEQRSHRLKQLDAMQAFTQGGSCRMLQLVRHFGDPTDSGAPCGICDRCAPGESVRVLEELERGVAAQILASLAGRNGQAVGRLFDEAIALDPRVQRSGFERLLSALERARLVTIEQGEFEKDGKLISFRRVSLTQRGSTANAKALEAIEIDGPAMSTPRVRSRARKKAVLDRTRAMANPEMASDLPKLFEELRAWRLTEARKKGVPAFRILSDRVLQAVCELMPASEEQLLQVPGIGPKIVRQYGEALLEQIRSR